MSTILNSLPFPPQFSDEGFKPVQSVELDVAKDKLRDAVDVWAQSVRKRGFTVYVDQLDNGLCMVNIVQDDENGEFLRGEMICVGVRGQFPRFA